MKRNMDVNKAMAVALMLLAELGPIKSRTVAKRLGDIDPKFRVVYHFIKTLTFAHLYGATPQDLRKILLRPPKPAKRKRRAKVQQVAK